MELSRFFLSRATGAREARHIKFPCKFPELCFVLTHKISKRISRNLRQGQNMAPGRRRNFWIAHLPPPTHRSADTDPQMEARPVGARVRPLRSESRCAIHPWNRGSTTETRESTVGIFLVASAFEATRCPADHRWVLSQFLYLKRRIEPYQNAYHLSKCEFPISSIHVPVGVVTSVSKHRIKTSFLFSFQHGSWTVYQNTVSKMCFGEADVTV